MGQVRHETGGVRQCPTENGRRKAQMTDVWTPRSDSGRPYKQQI
jgi:hypothetical protein